MEKILFSWSSGKDSALALQEIQRGGQYEIVALLTTLTQDYDRVSMHGVQRGLLEAQAAVLGLPLEKVWIGRNASNQDYETQMRAVLERYQAEGVQRVAFGDLFLEDIRKYRQANLAQIGMCPIFPLWGKNTRGLAQQMLREGFRSVVTCVDTQVLAPEFAGREIDAAFLIDLPPTVDPCGENGEFHTFVYAAPIFAQPIRFSLGEKVLRDNRFYFADLIPVEIKSFRPEDQAEVKSLILAGLVDHWGVLDPTKNPDLNDIAHSYAGATFLVAWQAGRVVGSGALVPRGGGRAEVVRMSVAKDLRRSGIGKLILTRLIEQARTDGYSQVFLETTDTWQEVIAFYLRFGFEITHYSDGDVYFRMLLSK
jgi:uncharacterized protein (TIGR00290 family)